MKANAKSAISMFLVLCLLFSFLPAVAVPAEAASVAPSVTNGGFEDGINSWTPSVAGTISAVTTTAEEDNSGGNTGDDEEIASEGDYAAKITGTSNKHIWADFTVTPETNYTITWDFKGATNANYAIYVYDATHGNTAITNYAGKNNGDGWETKSHSFKAPAGCTKIQIWLRMISVQSGTTGTIYYDKVSVVENGTTDNILANGGFESGADGWRANDAAAFSIVGAEKLVTDGNCAAKITGTSNKHIWADFAVTPETNYTITWDFKGATNAQYAIYVYDATNGNAAITNYAGKNNGDGWETKSHSFKAPAGCTKVQIWLRMISVQSGTTGTIYYDKVSVVKQGTTDNVLANGSFENGKDGWSANDSGAFSILGEQPDEQNAAPVEGTHALRLSHTADAAVTHSGIALQADTLYVLSFWAKGATGDTKISAKLTNAADNSEIATLKSFSTSGDEWVEKTFAFRTPEGLTGAKLTLQMTGGGTVFFDKVSVIERTVDYEAFTLLGNGDFEVGKLCWAPLYSSGVFKIVEDTTSPETSSVAMAVGTEKTRAAVTQTISVVAGGTYTLTFAAKTADISAVMVTLECMDDKQASVAGGRMDHKFSITNTGWNYYIDTFKIPEGATQLRLSIGDPELGARTLYLDGIYLDGPMTEAQKNEANGIPVDNVEEKTPIPGETNIISNGSYEKLVDGVPEGLKSAGKDVNWGDEINVIKTGSKDGNNHVQIISDGTLSALGYGHVLEEGTFVPGATYQLTFWYKSNARSLAIKLEMYNDKQAFPDSKHSYVQQQGFPRTTVWTKAEMTFMVPYVTNKIEIFIRNYSFGTTYVDDVQMVMVREPEFLDYVTADRVFHYEDVTGGTATAKLYESMKDSEYTASFKLLDGQTVLQKSDAPITFADGKADWKYSVEGLEKEKKYTIEATVTRTVSKTTEVATQNIYRVDRPEYVSEKGFYTENGKDPLTIQIGYHFGNTGRADEAKEMGLTVVQVPLMQDMAAYKKYFDAIHAAGMKAALTLHHGAKPAAHPDNIDFSLELIKTFKDHPALLGYIVQDEPFGDSKEKDHKQTELYLQESYRMIRELDKKHPVILNECVIKDYSKTVKYCDILFVDPYPSYNQSFLTYQGDTGVLAVEVAAPDNKPVVNVLQTFTWDKGSKPKTGEVRHMMYQVFLNGQQGIGYYTFQAEGADAANYFDLADPACAWNAEITSFNKNEMPLFEKHFILKETPTFTAFKDKDIQYETWKDGDKLYIALVNRTEDAKKAVVSVSDGKESVNGKITVLQGSKTIAPTISKGKMTLELTGSDALLICVSEMTTAVPDKDNAETGDSFNLVLWSTLTVLSACAVAVVLTKKRSYMSK